MQMYAGEGRVNEYAVMFKAKNGKDAKKNLDFIGRQIRRKTPVKFKNTRYRGYEINYLSMKGFFKIFLGKLFERFDKPFYTIIDDQVIFSNHPQTLKNIINDYIDANTLYQSEDFRAFYSNFSANSGAFAYVNTSILFESLEPLVSRANWREISQNEQFITCFNKLGIQLKPKGDLFQSDLFIQFSNPEEDVKEESMIAEAVPEEALAPLPLLEASLALVDSSFFIDDDKEKTWEDYMEELHALDVVPIEDLSAKAHKENYEDGTVKYNFDTRAGLKSGDFRAYHENGELKFKGKYKNDLKDGTWRIYNEKGKSIKKLKFDEGVLDE